MIDDIRDMLEEIGSFLGFLVAALAIPLLVLVGIGYGVDKYSCSRKADKMELSYDHGFWTGCRVEVNGRYVDINDYRVTEELVDE